MRTASFPVVMVILATGCSAGCRKEAAEPEDPVPLAELCRQAHLHGLEIIANDPELPPAMRTDGVKRERARTNEEVASCVEGGAAWPSSAGWRRAAWPSTSSAAS